MWLAAGQRDAKAWEDAQAAAALVALAYELVVLPGQPQTETTATAGASLVALTWQNIAEEIGQPQTETTAQASALVALTYDLVVIPGQPQTETTAQAGAALVALTYDLVVIPSTSPATEGATAGAALVSISYV